MVDDDCLCLRKAARASRSGIPVSSECIAESLAQRLSVVDYMAISLDDVSGCVDDVIVRVARFDGGLEREQLLDVSVCNRALQDFTVKTVFVNDDDSFIVNLDYAYD
jgi:hypothetical protein